MLGTQENVDQYFNLSDKVDLGGSPIEEAKTTVAYPDVMFTYNNMHKPVLYVRFEGTGGPGGTDSTGGKLSIRPYDNYPREKQLIIDAEGSFKEHGNVYDFSPLKILPLLIEKNITTADLPQLFHKGFFRNLRLSKEVVSRQIKHSYRFIEKRRPFDIGNRREQIDVLVNQRDQLGGYDPRRLLLSRQISQIEDEIETLYQPFIDKYLTYEPLEVMSFGEITLDTLPFLGRVLGLPGGHSAGAQSATYRDNRFERQNDWFDLLENQSVVVIDGTGHGDKNWQSAEAPIYEKKLVPSLNKFILSEDQSKYSTETVGGYKTKLLNVYQPFASQYISMLEQRRLIINEENGRFDELFDELLSLSVDNPAYQSTMEEFIDSLDLDILIENIVSSTKGTEGTGDGELNRLLLRLVTGGLDPEDITEDMEDIFSYLKGVSQGEVMDVKRLFSRAIESKTAKAISGSAMGITIPIHTADMNYALTFSFSDVCTMYFEPKPNPEDGYTLKSVMTETLGELGNTEKQIMNLLSDNMNLVSLPRGGVYLTFTDGIGEFLSADTISSIFLHNLKRGPLVILNKLMEAIRSGGDIGKYQASRVERLEVEVKEYDPDVITKIDDVAIAYGYVRPAVIY